jgi:hypothetical protein
MMMLIDKSTFPSETGVEECYQIKLCNKVAESFTVTNSN